MRVRAGLGIAYNSRSRRIGVPGVTVDTPVPELRPRQVRAGFSIPPEVPLPHAARLRAGSDPDGTARSRGATWTGYAAKGK